MISDKLLKEHYIFEIRYLDHVEEKPNVYTVKIKQFSESEKRIVVMASGYSPDSLEEAYKYAEEHLDRVLKHQDQQNTSNYLRGNIPK